MLYDATNERRVALLHPAVARLALELLRRVKAEGIVILVTQTLRTIEYQDALYAQGRTTPGIVVTWVRGGYSYHNYGLALDYCLVAPDGSMDWTVSTKWRRVAQIAKELGFEWGGDWSWETRDNPHLEYTFGLSTSQLRAGQQPPDENGEDENDMAALKEAQEQFKPSAENILNSYLIPAWEAHNVEYEEALAAGDTERAEEIKAVRDWQHTLADAVRDAANIPKE